MIVNIIYQDINKEVNEICENVNSFINSTNIGLLKFVEYMCDLNNILENFGYDSISEENKLKLTNLFLQMNKIFTNINTDIFNKSEIGKIIGERI